VTTLVIAISNIKVWMRRRSKYDGSDKQMRSGDELHCAKIVQERSEEKLATKLPGARVSCRGQLPEVAGRESDVGVVE
jgi:hypothetical protein